MEEANDALLLMGKPSWLLGAASWPRDVIEDFYYGAVWCESSAVNPFARTLFDRGYSGWSPVDRHLLDFIEANSLAVAVWCYYQPIRHMINRCKHVLIADEPSECDTS